ncbi:hypothetical protein ACFL1G_10335 [Planctomycetota bacterium]
MKSKEKDKILDNLPGCAAEFIKLVIKKMRYRRKVQAQVQAELTAPFEDELSKCKSDEDKEQKAQQLIADFGNPKLLGVLLRRAKKRCRPLWRTVFARASQAIVIIFVCLVVYIGWFLSGKPVVTVDYIAELNRMVRPSADDNSNAAPFYIEAAELYEKWPDDISNLLGEKYHDVNDMQKQRIEQFLEDNSKTLELVIAGSKKPYYWREYSNKDNNSELMTAVLLPNLAEFRRLAYSLCWRAWLRAGQVRYEEAFDDLTACYRFGRHLKGDKFLIEQLVGIAIEALSALNTRDIVTEFQVDAASLALLQKDLQQAIIDEDFTVSFETEKLFLYDEIQRCFTEGIFSGGHIYLPRIRKWRNMGGAYEGEGIILDIIAYIEACGNPFYVLFAHPNKRQTRQMADKFYAFWDKIADKTPAQIRAENVDVEAKVNEFIENNILLNLLTPAFSRVIEISCRCKADVLATLSIIAIERYNQDTGQYPSSFQQLVEAGYLKQLPIDPWSDKPLVYRTTDDGFILYGVGTNFEDDGGQIAIDDRGRIEKYADEGDWVFWPLDK